MPNPELPIANGTRKRASHDLNTISCANVTPAMTTLSPLRLFRRTGLSTLTSVAAFPISHYRLNSIRGDKFMGVASFLASNVLFIGGLVR